MSIFDTAVWHDGRVRMMDQRLLPDQEVYLEYESAAAVADGIRDMVVRGAPAIGCAAAYGFAVEAKRLAADGNPSDWRAALEPGIKILRECRPTAVNLMWAIDRMWGVVDAAQPGDDLPAKLLAEAHAIRDEDIDSCKTMGRNGAAQLPQFPDRPTVVMTHCNAGALATGGYGTALGVIRAAVEAGQNIQVIANETRPYLQGARLTAWELIEDNVDTTLVTDNMAGHLMSRGEVDAVVVGTDRVAANGDVANKIGTYTLAVLAKRHNIPFFVAGPLSTIDRNCPDGAHIPIEERDAEEVTHFRGQRTAALKVKVRNPAFDVTPAELVTALVTEKGVVTAPTREKIAKLFES
ncbi:S-methyl-5-thioribose-1-phosphate isomerase [Magnetofaba australis]|uniref:Methylthioribose-1-phosphate isomerase n=1 Tax=Magnetofaba australis IT-1 TaxID=1434232 RepID=A0A1Y2K352_9PROT|nr:S-methyl-5-thioribose-1-phosphate isomerase [Magnetofaba australis]OSM02478.1 putative translation initiation factor 2subunit beta I [Magnetofaba australis IT-1]